MDPIKICFYADSFAGTSGYSRVAKALATRIANDPNFEVTFQEIASSAPGQYRDGVKIVPVFGERGSQSFINSVVHHIRIFAPKVYIAIGDPWLMVRDKLHLVDFKKANMKLITYGLVDSENLPDTSEDLLDNTDTIITASEYGKKQLSDAGYESEILWHGVEFDKYKPVNNYTKKSLREEWNLPINKTIFLTVCRNFMRKQPERLLTAIAKYNINHPDNNSYFVLHISDATAIGHDLKLFKDRLISKLGCKMDNVLFTEEHKLGNGLSEEKLIQLYQLSDFYLTASSGEGFGLPIIESMACKIPCIAPNNTTHSTFLAEGRGLLADNDGYYYAGLGTKQYIVSEDDLADKIYLATIMTVEQKIEMTTKAYNYVKENCDWDKIVEQLKSIIKRTL